MNVTPIKLDVLKSMHKQKKYKFFPDALHKMVENNYWKSSADCQVHTNYRYLSTIANFMKEILIEWDEMSAKYNGKKYAKPNVRLLSMMQAKCARDPNQKIAIQSCDKLFSDLNGSSSSKTPRIYALVNIFIHFLDRNEFSLESNVAANVARAFLSKLYLFYIVSYSPKKLINVVIPWHEQYPQFKLQLPSDPNSTFQSQTTSKSSSVLQSPSKNQPAQIPELPNDPQQPTKQQTDPFTSLIEVFKAETGQSAITESQLNVLMVFFAETDGDIARTIAKVFEQCQETFYNHN